MARDWEATFRYWARPSSDTEDEKRDRTERMIREAINSSEWLRERVNRVFAKGSYANNTNVRQESDVDICVQAECLFYEPEPFPGFNPTIAGISPPCPYTFEEFKDEVSRTLVSKFGARGVTRGDKAFDVHETSTRVDADVVACFGYRDFPASDYQPRNGTKFYSDSGMGIENWPDQQLANGVRKNSATGGRYKFITRAVKRLRNEMADQTIAAAVPIPSYFIECLMWNVPNEGFGHDSYTADVRYALAHTFNATIAAESCNEWGEVNEVKYLFRATQPWTVDAAHAFLSKAWDYVGFE